MNEKLMEIFARNIVASLPTEKRRVYQFIESIEDRLAQQSETKEQFLNLLRELSPHRQAAKRFNMSIVETVKLMHEIENEINKKLEIKREKYKWIDFTEKVDKIHGKTNTNKKYFLFIS